MGELEDMRDSISELRDALTELVLLVANPGMAHEQVCVYKAGEWTEVERIERLRVRVTEGR
jgi:hypothetical protein